MRALLFLILVSISACGSTASSLPAASSSCDKGVALIGVSDAELQALCGCQETTGNVTVAGQTLTCTIKSGTSVVFQYLPSQLRHQINSTGSPSFPTGPVFDPSVNSTARSYGITLTAAGTYNFQDTFVPQLLGKIVVQ